MRKIHPRRTLFLIWIGWLLVLVGFQTFIPLRFNIEKPDRVLSWTASLTPKVFDPVSDPILAERFLGTQVSFDSKLYLSIATVGYDDPRIPFIMPSHLSALPQNKPLSLNYAFFPLYSFAIRLLAMPLGWCGLARIPAAILAGVILSVVGTLAAMGSLYDLSQAELGNEGGIRTAYYLVIFPTGFFLAQVFTEGIFAGLAFTCLALLRRKAWVWASILAVLAVLARAVGLALVVPMAWAWFREQDWKISFQQVFSREVLGKAMLILLPVIAYLVFRFSYLGKAFDIVEREYFGQQLFAFKSAWINWKEVLLSLPKSRPQTQFYFSLEIAGVLLAVLALIFTIRKYPDLALFSFLALLVPLTSGAPQSMVRYVLVIPSIYLFLGKLGRNVVFDRIWTIASLMLMTLLTILYTFDMWVA